MSSQWALAARGRSRRRNITRSGDRQLGCVAAVHLLLLLVVAVNLAALPAATSSAPAEQSDESLTVVTRRVSFRGVRLAARRRQATSAQPNDDVVGFLGIRFASAPIRRLRFMPPTPYNYAPNRIHDAQHFGPICMQRFPMPLQPPSAGSPTFSGEVPTSGAGRTALSAAARAFGATPETVRRLTGRNQSEDCLNLNVYAPLEALKSSRVKSAGEQAGRANNLQAPNLRPVLVLIQGDSFDYGAGSALDPFEFVRSNRMLAVTFNYRLNILGFPPKVSGAPSNANLGLLDQVAALHWISENVDSFGGSPRNVTVMGVKTGAIFVNLLMLSPLANGLFQRAIMEDGAALTPLVANHLQAAGQQHHQLQLQHVRLLAKLADCPIGRPNNLRSLSPLAQPANLTVSAAATEQLPAPVSAEGETKTNSLAFECLRHKPVEQIMQRVPLDLLQFSEQQPAGGGSGGHLSVAAKFHAPIEMVASAAAGDANEGATFAELATHLTTTSQSVNSSQLTRLIGHLARLYYLREGGSKFVANYSLGSAAGDPLELLLGAIYRPPTQTMRPLFAPHVDSHAVGSRVETGSDLASAMLSSESHFGRRDLLVGLSRASILPRKRQKDVVGVERRHQTIRADNLLAERLSERVLHSGLSDEQAVELANNFVRSFFRFHQQEIANSIMNEYLSAGSWAPSDTAALAESANSTGRVADRNSTDELDEQRRQKQLFVTSSLLEAFQDALTNVPILKTALIHSTRQLDTLASVFLAQQLAFAEQITGNDDADAKSSFLNFARNLSEHFSWPIELASQPSGHFSLTNGGLEVESSGSGLRSTYLFQLDASLLVDSVQMSIANLDSLKQLEGHPTIGVQLKQILLELLNELESSEFENSLSLSCAFEFDGNEDIEDDQENSSDATIEKLYKQLRRWFCSRLGQVLADFVTSGNMASRQAGAKAQVQLGSEQLASFVSLCEGKLKYDDHHLVQLGDGSGQRTLTADTKPRACKRHLAGEIATDYLLAYLEAPAVSEQLNEDENIEDQELSLRLPIFNLLTQQVVSLIDPKSPSQVWQANRITSDKKTPSERKFALNSRLSFWANFVPALNCARTQPVAPAALLFSGSGLSNNSSSLSSANLLFNCNQQTNNGHAKTAQNILNLLSARVKQQIDEQKLLARHLQQANQSHLSVGAAAANQKRGQNLANLSELPNGTGTELSEAGNSSKYLSRVGNSVGRLEQQEFALSNILSATKLRPADLVGLIACAALLGISIFFSVAYNYVKRRRSRQREEAYCEQVDAKSHVDQVGDTLVEQLDSGNSQAAAAANYVLLEGDFSPQGAELLVGTNGPSNDEGGQMILLANFDELGQKASNQNHVAHLRPEATSCDTNWRDSVGDKTLSCQTTSYNETSRRVPTICDNKSDDLVAAAASQQEPIMLSIISASNTCDEDYQQQATQQKQNVASSFRRHQFGQPNCGVLTNKFQTTTGFDAVPVYLNEQRNFSGSSGDTTTTTGQSSCTNSNATLKKRVKISIEPPETRGVIGSTLSARSHSSNGAAGRLSTGNSLWQLPPQSNGVAAGTLMNLCPIHQSSTLNSRRRRPQAARYADGNEQVLPADNLFELEQHTDYNQFNAYGQLYVNSLAAQAAHLNRPSNGTIGRQSSRAPRQNLRHPNFRPASQTDTFGALPH